MSKGLVGLVAVALAVGCGAGGPGEAAPLAPGPADLRSSVAADRTVTLDWSNRAGPWRLIEIQGRIENDPWQSLGNVDGASTGAVTTLSRWPADATRFSFRVRGHTESGAFTAWSNQASFYSQPPAPLGLRAVAGGALGDGPVTVSWTNPSAVATQASLQRSYVALDGTTTDRVALAVPAGATSYIDQPLPPGQAALYWVRYTIGGTGSPEAQAFCTFSRPSLPPPGLEVVPGVGVRVSLPPAPPGGSYRVHFSRADSSMDRDVAMVVPAHVWAAWPPNASARFSVAGATNVPNLTFTVALASAWSALPPFDIDGGDGRFRARAALVPRGMATRAAGGPLHVGAGCALWREDPAGWTSLPPPPPASGCAAPATDRSGRLRVLQWRFEEAGRLLLDATFDGTTWTSQVIGRISASLGPPTVARWFPAGGAAVSVLEPGQVTLFSEAPGDWGRETFTGAGAVSVGPDGTVAWSVAGGFAVRAPGDPTPRLADIPPGSGSVVAMLAGPAGELGILSAPVDGAGGITYRLEWRDLGPAGWSPPVVLDAAANPHRPTVVAQGDGGEAAVLWTAYDAQTGVERLGLSRRSAGAWKTTLLLDDWETHESVFELGYSVGFAGGKGWVFKPTSGGGASGLVPAGWAAGAIYEEQ